MTNNVGGKCNHLEDWGGSRHLVRVHGDVPGATLAIVVVVGIVLTAEGSWLRRQILRAPTARVCPWKDVTKEKDSLQVGFYKL